MGLSVLVLVLSYNALFFSLSFSISLSVNETWSFFIFVSINLFEPWSVAVTIKIPFTSIKNLTSIFTSPFFFLGKLNNSTFPKGRLYLTYFFSPSKISIQIVVWLSTDVWKVFVYWIR